MKKIFFGWIIILVFIDFNIYALTLKIKNGIGVNTKVYFLENNKETFKELKPGEIKEISDAQLLKPNSTQNKKFPYILWEFFYKHTMPKDMDFSEAIEKGEFISGFFEVRPGRNTNELFITQERGMDDPDEPIYEFITSPNAKVIITLLPPKVTYEKLATVVGVETAYAYSSRTVIPIRARAEK